MTEMDERYWLRENKRAWREATREEFISAERAAGFHPKSGEGVATGGFSNGALEGRVTYGEITKERYGYDPDFLAAVEASLSTPPVS